MASLVGSSDVNDAELDASLRQMLKAIADERDRLNARQEIGGLGQTRVRLRRLVHVTLGLGTLPGRHRGSRASGKMSLAGVRRSRDRATGPNAVASARGRNRPL